MSEQLIDDLKRRHGYETWRGTTTLSENLFIWQFFLAGNELGELRLVRIQALHAPDWPPATQSIWRPPEAPGEALLRLDCFQCPSRSAAHEFLVRLLSEFQSPDIGRAEDAVGDVEFAPPGEGAVLFARANLAVLLRNAGAELVSVSQSARLLDGMLVDRPAVGGTVVPEITRFAAVSPPVAGRDTPLDVQATDPLGRRLWFKLYTQAGEVRVEGERLVYRAESPGPDRITLFAINENGGVAASTIDVTAEPSPEQGRS